MRPPPTARTVYGRCHDRGVSAEVTVHVRLVPDDPSVVESWADLLDADELARAARRSNRARYVTAHALLRTVVAGLTAGGPGSVAFDRRCATCASTAHGKPVVRGHPGLFVSLSYAGRLAAVAATRVADIGIDVEQYDEADFDGFDQVTLAPEERAAFSRQVGAAPATHSDVAASRARVWARKEAVLKASGHGLVVDPRQVVVTGPHDPASLVAWRGEHELTSAVDLQDVPLPQSGYAAALAVLSRTPVTIDVVSS